MELKKSVLINASGKYTKVVLSLLVNAVLARILSPEDYGIVAVVTVFSTFFTTFSDMGFGPAIIQKKDLTKEDINNIYSFTVYVSVVLMFVFILCAYPIASFYEDDVFISLGQMLSIALLFNALNMVPNGILNREKKFASIAVRTVVVYVGASVISIFLAFMGFRYYALAIQAILVALFTFIWNFGTTRPRFRFKIDMDSIKKVINYSSYQFAFNLINYFSKNLDNLLIGKFMGSAELGYYNKAYTLMVYPVNNLTGVISPVLHPVLSDYQQQLDIIYRKYMKIVHLLACVGLYIAPVCFLGANEIINIFYGRNWGASVSCFQYLSIAIVPQMINSSSGAIFQSLGNTRQLFANGLINTCVTVIAILIGVFVGGSIETVSICVAAAYLFHFITASVMLIKLGFKYQLIAYIKDLVPVLFVLLAMIAGVVLYPFSIESVLLSIFVKCVYLGIFFIGSIFVSREYKQLLFLLKK
ncbi:lipopolysaccharide biosynthesis protein [Eubacteriaceae bacterium ES3]|nr:lipopolysaccharide biosynthesis protein [Eubacteriaceae bacterium ES3]